LKLLPALAFLAAMGTAQLAQASPGGTASGGYGALTWTAGSTLTGTTNTQAGGPVLNGGDPIYWPSYPRDSGVVYLLMDYGTNAAGTRLLFTCSGSLLGDRRSIVTAAHCVSDGAGTANPLATTVFFQPPGGLPPGTRIETGTLPNGGAVTRNVDGYFVNAGYTGDVIDKNDIAVLRMSTLAPDWAASYGLYESSDLQSKTFMVEGYGRLGDGATGTNNFTARLRNGDNRYDIRMGDPDFGTDWSLVLGEPMSQIDEVWMSDFDNGLAANDAACVVTTAGLGLAASPKYCNLGTGAREVGVAPGDSGGPQFIDGLISGVNSFGLTFGRSFGDSLCIPTSTSSGCLQSSFGEFSGFVPTYLHTAFIRASMVPEPGSLALLALALLTLTTVTRRRSAR
jgi:hypothetical protein